MSVFVSVIIPVYNAEKWLRESLDSVCGQSLKNIEIICINDGSPDHSLQILKEYASRDDRIVIIDKANEGVGAARNDGIRAAKGEYVAFLDPDDMYPNPDVLKLLYDAAKEHQVLVAGGFLGFIDINGNSYPSERSYYGIDFTCAGIVRYADFQCDYQFTAYLYCRDFLIQNRLFFPRYVRFQDPPFFVRVMTAAEIFFAVDQATYIYRVGTPKRKFSFQTAFDVMCGISDNLSLSKEKRFSRLHFLSTMRLLKDASFLVENLRDDPAFSKLVWKYIKTAGLIDEELISSGGYTLPTPPLPGLFTGMIEESKQYRSLMKHKCVRAYRKLFVRK